MPKGTYTEQYLHFRKLLVSEREKAGLTQSQVAAKLSHPQSYVSKYENGERRLDVVEFLEAANAIGFDPVKFIKKLTL